MLAFIFSPLGRYLLGAVAILAVVGAIYMKGRSDGAAKVQARWDAAISNTNKAVDDAVRGADSDVRDGVRDKWDRDEY